MSKIIKADFVAPDAKTRNLIERMRRFELADRLELLRGSFPVLAFRSRFTLADQVLLHGFASSHTAVTLLDAGASGKSDAVRESLVAISGETYGIAASNEMPEDTALIIDSTIKVGSKTSFAGKDVRTGVVAVNPVADWTYEELVQYVLDHEVPVNPADMPGAKTVAA